MYTWRFIRDLYLHIKYSKIIKKVIKDEGLLHKFSQLYGVNFKEDWIGRIYAVLNPYIKNGKYDPEAITYENTAEGFDPRTYLENWIMERLAVASQFIHANNLFELLTYDIKKLDEDDNFLFVVQPVTLSELQHTSKKFFRNLLILIVLAAIGFAIYYFN